MRVVIVTGLILLSFFIGALVFMNYVQVNCDTLLTQIEELDKALVDEDWTKVDDRLKIIKEGWTNIKHNLELFIEHNDMDRAEVALAKMNKYIANKEKALVQGEVAELKFVVDLIKKKEALKLSNLL